MKASEGSLKAIALAFERVSMRGYTRGDPMPTHERIWAEMVNEFALEIDHAIDAAAEIAERNCRCNSECADCAHWGETTAAEINFLKRGLPPVLVTQ